MATNEVPSAVVPHLDCYWGLASVDCKERAHAAASLAVHMGSTADAPLWEQPAGGCGREVEA